MHPPDPKRPRLLHGVLVMRENEASTNGGALTLMQPDEACTEAGVNRHTVRFTTTVSLTDEGSAAVRTRT